MRKKKRQGGEGNRKVKWKKKVKENERKELEKGKENKKLMTDDSGVPSCDGFHLGEDEITHATVSQSMPPMSMPIPPMPPMSPMPR